MSKNTIIEVVSMINVGIKLRTKGGGGRVSDLSGSASGMVGGGRREGAHVLRQGP